ncbi:MAG: argininosuccinate lyase [Spirochaetales bacterium]|nr:argininosuccinate lyase [Spirochaetales bacterium]
MGKLWDKGEALDALIESFTVGDDYLLDDNLVGADALGSIAHARVLHKAGLLSDQELSQLEENLGEIITRHQRGEFPITLKDEDCHTAIENFLTKAVGEAGKKIHTGRSRNDQVQTALRLWMREFLLTLLSEVTTLVETLFTFAQRHAELPMAGRTHMQLAMPSSVGLWAASFGEELLDESHLISKLVQIINQSPLGAAASYGTPLPLDREYGAKQMGFKRVQNNVLYANNSRGKFEAMVVDGCDYITLTLSKLAQDLLLFTLPEIGYFSLPAELCTGSSIMPQKRNPDGLELIRSRSALVSAASVQIKSIIRSLPSGYNRDFQDTKEPLFSATKATLLSVRVMTLTIEKLAVHEEALLKGFSPEIFATDEVLKRVEEGLPFREIYLEVGQSLDKVGEWDPVAVIKGRTAVGTTGNLNLKPKMEENRSLRQKGEEELKEVLKSYKNLSPAAKPLLRW